MIPFRFIHAADLHLDSAFKGPADMPAAVRQQMADAGFGALRRLTETAIREEVDFVVMAGDLFDAADRSLRAQTALYQAWSRLAEAGISVFAIHGNHDPLDSGRARLKTPDNVHVFGAGERAECRPAYRRDGKLAAYVYGISYERRAVTHNLVPGYRPAADADFHIALLHANVDGDPRHDPYAPCTLAELKAAGFDYWALGHIHDRRVLHEYPHVVYPGNLQGRHPGETGAKGCYLVQVDVSGRVDMTFQPLDEVRWLKGTVPIDGLDDEDKLLARMEEAVRSAEREADGRPVMLEIALEGRGPLHRRLEGRGADDALAALRERLDEPQADGEAGWVWVHRVTVKTVPDLDLERLAEEDSFAGEMLRLARTLAADAAKRDELLAEALEPLMRNPRLRRLLGESGGPAADGLIERAAVRLAGMLHQEEE